MTIYVGRSIFECWTPASEWLVDRVFEREAWQCLLGCIGWQTGSRGILGFGVSGTKQLGLPKPVFGEAPVWLTGGPFGLDASVPGLIYIVAALLLRNMWRLQIAKELTARLDFLVKNRGE